MAYDLQHFGWQTRRVLCRLDARAWKQAGSRSSIGSALKSDGTNITQTDWRANRLADALAKTVASQHQVDRDAVGLLSDEFVAYEYGAVLIGVTCRASNCCRHLVHLPMEAKRQLPKEILSLGVDKRLGTLFTQYRAEALPI